MNPLISIITPSFNSQEYLEQTIDSILGQGIKELQYIIIDGGSTDGTVDIIRKYEKHLTYWVSENDSGQSEAINKGLRMATGEVINWINSDDYLEKGALKKISNYFQDPECKVLCGRSRNFSVASSKISRGTDVFENVEKTIGQARIDQPETWFRREAFESTGLLSEQLHYLMDREWWIRYLLINGTKGIVQTDDLLVHFRLHEKSKTVAQAEKFQIDHDTIFASLFELFEHLSIRDLIRNNFSTGAGYEFPLLKKTAVDIELVLQYFLLKRGHECYYAGEHDTASIILRAIDPSRLSLQDQKLYKKLKFRNSPLISRIRALVK